MEFIGAAEMLLKTENFVDFFLSRRDHDTLKRSPILNANTVFKKKEKKEKVSDYQIWYM